MIGEEILGTYLLGGIMMYDIILADPPWQFSNYSDEWHKQGEKSRWVGKKYATMSPEDIESLPIKSIASKDSVLFLWATFPKLPQALKTMEAWGFKYKTTGFVWVKKNKVADTFFTGMGFYTRSNAEICLIGVRGKGFSRISKSVRQIIYSPLRGHSQKPEEAKERIIELFGDRPRIELFAREKTDGWDAWGNEVESDIDL